jgi:ABC-2 type transport system ATP-binding protein
LADALSMSEAIVIEGLRKSYGRVRALQGVDLKMPAGSIYGFLGPNGCGKTTTIKVLLGLALADAGHASIFGVPVERYRADSRAEVGYLAQDPSFPRWMTGREVLEFVGGLYANVVGHEVEQAREMLHLVNLEAAADRRCGDYSAGMRQRLGIAQTLMGNPRLVVLDEPSSSLDPIGRRDVLDILRQLRLRGISVFYSTHILDDVERVADHVAIMKDGVVIRAGGMEAMMSSSEGRFRVTVEPPAPGIVDALRALPWVRDVEVAGTSDDRFSLFVDVLDATEAKRALPRAVIDADYVLMGCEPARWRLEEIFMESMNNVA